MLAMSLLFAPLGVLLDLLNTRDWWRPETLSGARVGAEAAWVAFTLTGVSTTIYKVVAGRRLERRSRADGDRPARGWTLLAVGLGLLLCFGGFYLLDLNSFVASILGGAVAIGLVWLKRTDLVVPSVLSGLLMVGTAALVYSALELLTPGWIDEFYLFRNVPPIVVFNLPLDDAVFYLLAGMSGGVLCESWLGASLVAHRSIEPRTGSTG